ncbi:MAG: hypothetical protein GY845_04170 [Planctomycetes bacterium]|nr:hypothetical protein [Planctomycetota bacterium]
MEVADDHVHIFLSFPPRYSIARVVGTVGKKGAIYALSEIIFYSQAV